MSGDIIPGTEDFIEIELKERDDFLTVRETLTRMGICSHHKKILYQSCHILHKRGRYFIVHFKELFKLDGKPTNISESDVGRRNRIALLLDEWGLLEIAKRCKDKVKEPLVAVREIKILPHKDKDEWTLSSKYSIGNGAD